MFQPPEERRSTPAWQCIQAARLPLGLGTAGQDDQSSPPVVPAVAKCPHGTSVAELLRYTAHTPAHTHTAQYHILKE